MSDRAVSSGRAAFCGEMFFSESVMAGTVEIAARDLNHFSAVMARTPHILFPVVAKVLYMDRQAEVLQDLCHKNGYHYTTYNFIALLAAHQMLGEFPAALDAFRQELAVWRQEQGQPQLSSGSQGEAVRPAYPGCSAGPVRGPL